MKGVSEDLKPDRNPSIVISTMKKTGRKIRAGLLILLIVTISSPLFYSCETDDDYYSLSNIWLSMGFIDKPQNSESFTINLDSGDTLVPISNTVPYFRTKDLQRVVVNYTILDEVGQSTKKFYVKINNLSDVLYKDIIELTGSNNDSIGNDPVQVDDIWVSKNLLNVEFRFLGGEMIHYINLTRPNGDINTITQPVELELRHNIRDDQQKYTMNSIVTFDLKNIKIPGQDSVKFVVKSTDYKGDKHTFNGTYYY